MRPPIRSVFFVLLAFAMWFHADAGATVLLSPYGAQADIGATEVIYTPGYFICPCYGTPYTGQAPVAVSDSYPVSGIPLAASSADLSTGVLRAWANSSLTTIAYETFQAFASFQDHLMFSGATAGQAASWGLALYGRTVSGISNDGTSLTGEILIGGWRCTRGTHIVGSRCTNGGEFVYAEMQSDLAQISMFHWNDHQATSLDFYPDMYPDGLDIRVMMQAQSGLVGTADGWDTGLLSLALPSNVTYTSSSGVFLSIPQATSVPEPAGWLLTGLGLVALAITRRDWPGRMQGIGQRAV